MNKFMTRNRYIRQTDCHFRQTHVEQIKRGLLNMRMSGENYGKRVSFSILAKPGSIISVAGTFNDWNPTVNSMKEQSGKGLFKTEIFIPQGRHEYKFVVDGTWLADPSCKTNVSDTFGSENSVLHILENELNASDNDYSEEK